MKVLTLNKELLVESNIPKKFWTLGLDTYFGKPEALKIVKSYSVKCDYCLSKGLGLFFASHQPQTCKTFLGTFVLKCALSAGFSARYTSLIDIARQYVGEGDTSHSLRQLYGSVEFLFIDDLVEGPNKAERNGLERVVLMRNTAGLPTLFASTFPRSELGEQYGPRTTHRIQNTVIDVETTYEPAAFAVAKHGEAAISEILGDSDVG